ncbi:hypothetical protein AB9M62_41470 [Bacillales bacterium AN1005]
MLYCDFSEKEHSEIITYLHRIEINELKIEGKGLVVPNKLNDVLSGREANYILPFFWQHGEDEVVLREEMARIHESGIGAVCVEARPHPDFLGPNWWRDMDIIIEEAKTRGMRVWVLDDDHFPTGHAACRLKDAPEELRRVFLSKLHIDALRQRRAHHLLSPFPIFPDFMKPPRPT